MKDLTQDEMQKAFAAAMKGEAVVIRGQTFKGEVEVDVFLNKTDGTKVKINS